MSRCRAPRSSWTRGEAEGAGAIDAGLMGGGCPHPKSHQATCGAPHERIRLGISTPTFPTMLVRFLELEPELPQCPFSNGMDHFRYRSGCTVSDISFNYSSQ